MEEKKFFTGERKLKLILWIILAVLLAYIDGHLSGSIQESGILSGTMELMERIKTNPFGFLHFNKYVFGFTFLFLLSAFFMTFFKLEKPKGDLLGQEHGSSHFQTTEELKKFLKLNTTEVYGYDYVEPEVDIPEEDTIEKFQARMAKEAEVKKAKKAQEVKEREESFEKTVKAAKELQIEEQQIRGNKERLLKLSKELNK